VLPWFYGLQRDLETLEVVESGRFGYYSPVRTGSAGQALGGKVKVARKRGGKEARKAVKPQHGGDSRGCGLL